MVRANWNPVGCKKAETWEGAFILTKPVVEFPSFSRLEGQICLGALWKDGGGGAAEEFPEWVISLSSAVHQLPIKRDRKSGYFSSTSRQRCQALAMTTI